jgi:hypothetical protein
MPKLGEGGEIPSGWKRGSPRKTDIPDIPGVTKERLVKLLNSGTVGQALAAKAEEVQKYWQSISPVFDASDPREHRKNPQRGHAGSYRDSVSIFDTSDSNGMSVQVKPTDWKSRMIEFGNKNMPEYAPMAKVKAKFGL